MSVPLRVAVVDDDEDMRGAIEALFISMGHAPFCYEGAAPFLRDLANARPNILVTDFQMPDVNGIQLTRLLRSERRDLPVILITAFATAHVRETARQEGIWCVLEKPFEPEDLLRCVAEAVDDRP